MVTEMLFLISGGSAELISGQTKLHTVFNNLTSFLSIFMIYISIRFTFKPTYGGPMCVWVKCLIGYSMKRPWPVVLSYIIDYYQLHQTDPPKQWLLPDGEMIALHFSFSNTTKPTGNGSSSPTKSTASVSNTFKKKDKCKNYNRPSGCTFPEKNNGRPCPRLHVCWGCGDKSHLSPNCPTNPGLPQTYGNGNE
jgi:hypothetical protein